MCCSPASTSSDLYPGTGAIADAGSGPGDGYTINVPVPSGSGRGRLALGAGVRDHSAGAERSAPQLVLISAGFDAHAMTRWPTARSTPRPSRRWRGTSGSSATRLGAPVGAVLEGGYEPAALAESVLATIRALDGEGEADSIAPDQIVTSRAATHVGQYWEL